MVGTLSAAPFDLSTIGGQSGSMLLVDILAVVPVMTDGSGNAAFSSPGVCDAALVNTSIYWQDFDVDLSLAFSLPVGNSTALETKMGI